MIFLTNITKSKVKDICKQLSKKIGSSFMDGGFWGRDSVVLNYRNTIILLEKSTFSHNQCHSTTTIKCSFSSTNGFKFNVSTKDAFTCADKVLGLTIFEQVMKDLTMKCI